MRYRLFEGQTIRFKDMLSSKGDFPCKTRKFSCDINAMQTTMRASIISGKDYEQSLTINRAHVFQGSDIDENDAIFSCEQFA
ncbi:predicted protein [Botrytis cinerea T4]|uniref:Uncharacterized protein n=1 Tax=Botryotinia fuckeliana (strain T4) TaxID=999810 RepID=G2YKC2_BOTF4|nr:predicted protein [Botrytis cinerea T4]